MDRGDDAGRNADRRHMAGNSADDRSPRADNGPRADVNLRYDGRADSDVRSFPDFHSAGKRRAR